MSVQVTAMITAIVGVLGTLLAPAIGQRLTAKQRAEEVSAEERRQNLEQRRAAYTSMNRSARQFHTLLKDSLHRVRDGVFTDQDRDQLEETRRDYRDRYAEAQMIVPERILDASRAVNKILADTDAVIKRLDRGLARESETPEQALQDLKSVEPSLSTMRRLMREDLGVDD